MNCNLLENRDSKACTDFDRKAIQHKSTLILIVIASIISATLLAYLFLALRKFLREKQAKALQNTQKSEVEAEFQKFQKYKQMEAIIIQQEIKAMEEIQAQNSLYPRQSDFTKSGGSKDVDFPGGWNSLTSFEKQIIIKL